MILYQKLEVSFDRVCNFALVHIVISGYSTTWGKDIEIMAHTKNLKLHQAVDHMYPDGS